MDIAKIRKKIKKVEETTKHENNKTEQKESPSLSINPKQTFAKIPTEILGITFRDAEWHFYPTFDGGKRQKIAINQGISWKIILDRTLFDDWLGLGFFQNSATLLNAGDRNLARQSNRTQVLINKRMKPNVIIDFIFPTFIDAELHSFFENFESPNDFRQSLNLNLCIHNNHFIEDINNVYKFNEDWQFLSTLKYGVSLPKIL